MDIFNIWYERGLVSMLNKNFYNLNEKLPSVIQKDTNLCMEDNIGDLKISIIIITHNRVEFLKKNLVGIFSQTYTNYEIIIIDDASTDNTREYISNQNDRRIKYYKNEINLGAGGSRRVGYKFAVGDIIIFSDDDDYYVDSGFFNRLNTIFKEDTTCCMVCANTFIWSKEDNKYIEDDIKINSVLSTIDYLNGFGTTYRKPNSSFSMAMRYKKIESIQYSKLRLFNDTSLYLYALLAEGTVHFIKEYIGIYCIHETNMSKGVAPEFIIENLDSKLDIYCKAKMKGILKEPNKWIYEQAGITIRYYFTGLDRCLEEEIKIFKWAYRNIKGFYRIRICLYIIKSILRRIYLKRFATNEN